MHLPSPLKTLLLPSVCSLLLAAQSVLAAPPEWTAVKTDNLSEWTDPSEWWRAENGVIVAESKGGANLPKVHYLGWNGAPIKGDFEVRLDYRIITSAPSDAGMNFRVERPFKQAPNIPSYQAELDTCNLHGVTNGKLFGHIHDGKRSRMFPRNTKVVINADGTEKKEPFATAFDPAKVFKAPPEWNECLVRVVGEKVELFLNGVLANEINDGDQQKRPAGDGIALQFRPSENARFEVKDLKYRLLK